MRRSPAAAAAVTSAAVLTAALVTAHYVDLRAKLAEAERTVAASDVERLLEETRTELNAGRWREAEDRLHNVALGRLRPAQEAYSTDPRLNELASEADRLQKQIDQGLTDDARLRQFRQCRRDASYFATPFSGLGCNARKVRTRESVERALQPFGLTPGSGSGLTLNGAYFTDAEKTEIREGCCEMLLELADSEPATGGDEPALAFLDHAARLGVDTPLTEWRRARRMALLRRAASRRSNRSRRPRWRALSSGSFAAATYARKAGWRRRSAVSTMRWPCGPIISERITRWRSVI